MTSYFVSSPVVSLLSQSALYWKGKTQSFPVMQTTLTIALQAKEVFVVHKKNCPRQQSEDIVSVNFIHLLLWTLVLRLTTGCRDMIIGYNKARGCYFHTSHVGFILGKQFFNLFLRAYLVCNNTFYRLVLFYPHNPFLHYKRWLKKTWSEFYEVLFISWLVSDTSHRYFQHLLFFHPFPYC